MRVLVLGGSGMLGHKLIQVLGKSFEVFTTIRSDFEKCSRYRIFDKNKTFENVDAENFDEIKRIIIDIKPDVIINAVGIIKQKPSAKNVVETLMINSVLI